jgi:FkbM family methyltransferase
MQLYKRLGLLDRLMVYRLDAIHTVAVPTYRDDNCWDRWDVLHYEERFLGMFCEAINRMAEGSGTVTLCDCGADIGLVSVKTAIACPAVSSIVAFEPNSKVIPVLAENLAALPLRTLLRETAVGNFDGRAALARPDYDASDHACFIRPDEAGDVSVSRIDRHVSGCGNLALKIDVEGGELEVLEGARDSIARAANCVISIEAHPLVAGRTGRDPVECLRFLQEIRPFRFTVAESHVVLELDRPVIAPGQTEIWNIVATTEQPSSGAPIASLGMNEISCEAGAGTPGAG